MSNQDYDDKNEEGDEQEDSTSLEGKGWDVLAGGKQNPFELGGDDPFDLKSPETPTPYTDDDEAHWILTSGAQAPAPQETPPDAYWDQGRSAQPAAGAAPSDQPTEAAPRDLSPAELGSMTAAELGADSGPITAPTSSAGAPGTGTGLSPGVDVTPLGPSGEPLAPPAGPGAGPIPSMPPSSGVPETPVGGPIVPPDVGPVTPPLPPPFVPATPPWDLPQQPQGLMPSDAFIRDPFFSPPRELTSAIGDEPAPKDDLAQLLITTDRVNAL